MESPGEMDLDMVRPIPMCVHEIETQLIIGVGPEGSVAGLILNGHDENGTPFNVEAKLPACIMDQLSIRLQEYQMAASMEGIGNRVSPGTWTQLRSLILDRFNGRSRNHGH